MTRKQGKVVHVEKVDIEGRTFDVPMRYLKDAEQWLVDMDDPAEIRVYGADYKTVLQEATEKLTAASKVDWHPVLVVRVSGKDVGTYTSREYVAAQSLLLEVSSWARAEVDGKVVHKYAGDMQPHYSRNNWVQPGEPFDEKDDEVMIPDTPENREKLQAIEAGIKSLGDRLQELLGEGKILKTLADFSQVKRLRLTEGA